MPIGSFSCRGFGHPTFRRFGASAILNARVLWRCSSDLSGDPIYKRFVILDRDGTLIVERNYLSSPDGVELLANATEGLSRFKELGWGRLVVTNQSGIGRGYFTGDTVNAIHDQMAALFARCGAEIDGIYVCPHTPEDNCDCRKPRTGLVLKAAADWGFEPSDCLFIGDKACDIELGRALGGSTILVLTGYGTEHWQSGLARPDFVVRDLNEAAEVAMKSVASREPDCRPI
jgi:D-glycero-D-manno-heptose 1,7-bisphosphate phosphatase